MSLSIRRIGARYPRGMPVRVRAKMEAPFLELSRAYQESLRYGHIYFMHDADAALVKIGFTRNLSRRLRTVKSASGRSVVLLGSVRGTVAEEARWHRRFDRLRESGEWFRATPALIRQIESATAIGVPS